ELFIEPLRPERCAVPNTYQLDSNSHSLSSSPNTAFQDRINIQFPANRDCIVFYTGIFADRAGRSYYHLPNIAQSGDQGIRQSEPEMVVRVSDTLERHDCDGLGRTLLA